MKSIYLLLFLASCVWVSAGIAQQLTQQTIIDVGDIKPGMRGYGLTVFKGTEPERFDVEVIDVLHNFRPDQDLILIRTPHPVLDHAIAVAGMSGSPIYIQNKLAGAYAYGWTFGKEPVVGVTPIKNMMREMRRPLREDPRLGPNSSLSAHAFSGFDRLRPYSTSTHQYTTPLYFSGFSDATIDVIAKKMESYGFSVFQAAGGGTTGRLNSGRQSLFKPGSAMAVQLIRGDINAHAIGTVTAVDHGLAVAFGHPMMNAGQTRLPTAGARIVHILSSYQRSFKMAEPLGPMGALVQDRPSGVVVDMQKRAPTIPLTVRLHGGPPYLRNEWHAELADHFAFTPMLTFSALTNALDSTVSDMTDVMLRLRSEVKVRGLETLRLYEETYLPMGLGQPMELARRRVFAAIDAAFNSPFGKHAIESIVLDVDINLRRQTLDLIDAAASADEVDPGQPVWINMVLRTPQGREERRRISFTPPERLKGSEVEFAIEPSHEVMEMAPEPRDLSGIFRILHTRSTPRGWVVSLTMPAKGMRFRGRLIENLPGAALDTLASTHAADQAHTFQVVERFTIPIQAYPRGSARFKVKIRESKHNG